MGLARAVYGPAPEDLCYLVARILWAFWPLSVEVLALLVVPLGLLAPELAAMLVGGCLD